MHWRRRPAVRRLAIFRKVHGEERASTAMSYNNLANTQQRQGKYAAAEEGYRKALAINRKVLGEAHPDTARTYNNLAANQNAQGKFAEAEEGCRKALAVCRKVFGEEHSDTANSYHNLAANQHAQGKYAAAEEGYRKALAIHRKVLGEEHPDTANSYSNVAHNLNAQGKYAEAEEGYRKALAIRRKVLGEEHPDTAASYGLAAYNQQAQGKYAEAEKGYRKALAIRCKVLGEEHPDTALSYNNLALNQYRQGKYATAEEMATKAADVFARIRLDIADTGLGRATITGERSPLFLLTALVARNGKPAEAWRRFEQSLGRGVGDDLATRLKRPASERQRQSQLLARRRLLEARVEKQSILKEPTSAQKEQRNQQLDQLLKTLKDLASFNRELEEKYGPVAGQVLEVAALQKALPADGAFLGWLDRKGEAKAADPDGEHWAVLLRRAESRCGFICPAAGLARPGPPTTTPCLASCVPP